VSLNPNYRCPRHTGLTTVQWGIVNANSTEHDADLDDYRAEFDGHIARSEQVQTPNKISADARLFTRIRAFPGRLRIESRIPGMRFIQSLTPTCRERSRRHCNHNDLALCSGWRLYHADNLCSSRPVAKDGRLAGADVA
jgi:hypothetical protein